ncbi:hypothetical protein QE152_g8587 [Popillia japonica]|uniref:Uncharacterized protein n=1 Tax=Popillia japonica TaxID=7064 RepID=A0AAW1M293_POPJA
MSSNEVKLGCTRTNRTLQETLTACLSANAELKTRISMLETALERSGADRVKEQGIYRQKLAALTRNLGEAMRERDICRKDRETELCKRVMEIEKNYAGILNAKQVEFDLKFEELRNKFEAENLTAVKVTQQLEASFEESTTLRNKLRQMQSKYIKEITDYRQELKKLERHNAGLNSKLAAVEMEAKRQRLHEENVKEKLRSHVREIEKELEENVKEKLRSHVREIEKELGDRIDLLITENKSLKKGYNRVNREILAYKNSDRQSGIVAPSRDEFIGCFVAEHKRFPVLLQQNEVLQEIVKTMRKERQILTRKQTEELKSAEERVDKLEGYIDSLKQAALSKVGFENLIPG